MPHPRAVDHMPGFLMRLLRDRRGNTLAMAAAMIFPLAGLVGGGLDMGRLYIAKTRLQHACDAGVLAGRKAMGAGTWAQANNMPRTTALQFFDGNYKASDYGGNSLTRSYTEQGGRVTGSASVRIPMTLMKIFGRQTETLSVACDADMRLPNTDIMFVLDTTGSMDARQPGDTVTKIQALRTSVMCFYEIVARLDTEANCTTGTPSGGTGNQVQIRFGFMPYSTNVNVGRLLPTGWFADSWQYQTREAMWTNTTTETWVQRGNPDVRTENASEAAPQSYCNQQTASQLDSNSETYSNNNTVRTNVAVRHTTRGEYRDGRCYGTKTTTTTTYDKRTETNRTFDKWRYNRLPVDVGLLKNGTAWRTGFDWPVGDGGTNRTIGWDGCIEERATVRTTDYDPIPNGTGDAKAWDLDIDLVPTATEARSRWAPALRDLIYTRYVGNRYTRDIVENNEPARNDSSYTCPTQAEVLQRWPDSTVAGQPRFEDYVNSLRTGGNTYHDIGLLWGARFLSPTGLFRNGATLANGQAAGRTSATPAGGEIERHLIFMTDGDACTNNFGYQAYGVAWWDRRQTPDNVAPTHGCTDDGTLTEQVNLRTAAICTAVKDRNITLWVIAFGTLEDSTSRRLEACATPGRYFVATSAQRLQQTFKSIADQISQLRLTS